MVHSVEQTLPAEPVSVHHVGGRCWPPRQEECLSHTLIHMMTVQHPVSGSCTLDLTLTVITAHVIHVARSTAHLSGQSAHRTQSSTHCAYFANTKVFEFVKLTFGTPKVVAKKKKNGRSLRPKRRMVIVTSSIPSASAKSSGYDWCCFSVDCVTWFHLLCKLHRDFPARMITAAAQVSGGDSFPSTRRKNMHCESI